MAVTGTALNLCKILKISHGTCHQAVHIPTAELSKVIEALRIALRKKNA
jgi:hypothetical protein